MGLACSQRQLILNLVGANTRASTIRIWRKNYAPKRTSASAASRAPHLTQREASLSQKRRPRNTLSPPARPRFGMMALTDASRHDWLEAAAPPHPPRLQDDATGQILAAHFQLEAEILSAISALCTPCHHSRHSPQSLRDRHSIFQRNDPTGPSPNSSPETISHPTRTRLEELGIQRSRLLSPGQRPHRARLAHLSDRLVSELRLARPPLARSQHRARPLLRRLQPRFAGPRRCRADFRSLPRRFDLARASAALSTRRRRRSHRHPRRELHRPAALPASRLCRETVELASSGRQSAVYRGDQLLLTLPLPLENMRSPPSS